MRHERCAILPLHYMITGWDRCQESLDRLSRLRVDQKMVAKIRRNSAQLNFAKSMTMNVLFFCQSSHSKSQWTWKSVKVWYCQAFLHFGAIAQADKSGRLELWWPPEKGNAWGLSQGWAGKQVRMEFNLLILFDLNLGGDLGLKCTTTPMEWNICKIPCSIAESWKL